jgi:carbon monoxide dehydrogenase subunit G
MYQVTASTDIEASPEAVWELYCDPHRYPEFADPTQRMVHVPEGPMGKGYTYREYAALGPFKGESEWTVTEFQPRRRQVHVGDDGTMRFHLEIDIEPGSTGCRLTQRMAVEPRGAAKIGIPVLWPLFMRRIVQQAMDRTVANVKRLVQASPSS